MQASNTIEGIDATIDDVLAAEDNEPPLEADAETYGALRGYQAAMTYVLQLAATDPMATIDASLLRSLHFMMMSYDLSTNPGVWRPGAVWVEREADGAQVYEGPDAELVPGLIDELVAPLAHVDGSVVVRATMAHLNLAMIHPFSDGNGRMARCLQSLVLARERIVAPEFASIEEYLGVTPRPTTTCSPRSAGAPGIRRTTRRRGCGSACRPRGAGASSPSTTPRPERLWEFCSALASARRLPDRVVPALVDAARGFRLRNQTYRRLLKSADGLEITDNTASRDLRALVDTGLLDPVGERRGRLYVAGEPLRDAWHKVRNLRPQRRLADGLSDAAQQRLPGF